MPIRRVTVAALTLLAACHPAPRSAAPRRAIGMPVAVESSPHAIRPGVLRGLMTAGELSFDLDDTIAAELRRLPFSNARTRLDVCLDVDGAATVELDDPSGSPAFDRAALAVARGWRFEPYRDDGAAAPACADVRFHAAWPEPSHDVLPDEARAVLPDAEVELPRAKVVTLELPRAHAARPPTAGLALAWVCRARGSRAVPQFGVLQWSGDTDVDGRLLARRASIPIDEAPGPDPVCELWSAIAPREGATRAPRADSPPTAAPPPRPPRDLPPQAFEAQRISGDTQVMPAMALRERIARSAPGTVSFLVVVKLCIDTAGRPASVTVLKTSGYAGYDADLANAVATWRYRPFTIDGEPAPACGLVNFSYRQTKEPPARRRRAHDDWPTDD